MNLTNASKAAAIVFVNSGISLAVVFGVPLSDVQQGAIGLFVNAALGLYVALTFKSSPRRIPDFPADSFHPPEQDFA